MSYDGFQIKVPELSTRLDPWSTLVFQDVVYTKETVDSIKKDTEIKDVKESAETKTKLTREEFYRLFVERTEAQCLSEAGAPQRSKQWHDARRYCITASSFGAVVGHNPYCSKEQALIEKLWASFQGSEYTAYGTFHEPDAAKSLLKALESTQWLKDFEASTYTFFETGLLKSYKQPWMAVSPDGFLYLKGSKGSKLVLVEFKCPAGQRDSELHPYRKSPKNVPVYYMDQIQGIMGLLNKYPELIDNELEKHIKDFDKVLILDCLFVVWQPHQMHVTRIPFDKKYYDGYLEPELKSWHEKFVSFATEKANGNLVKNTLESILNL